MRTGDEAFEAARDERPFSNGTEGYDWMEAWCERCVHDVDHENTGGCPLVAVAFLQRTPVEWVEGPRSADGGYSIQGQYECTEFQKRDDEGPLPEPTRLEELLAAEGGVAFDWLEDGTPPPGR